MKFGKILAVAAILAIVAGAYFIFNRPMFLNAADGVKIAYDFFDVSSPKGWLILTHMMPATKNSWRDFAEEMRGFGYASVAIDLRGHGQSDGGPNGYLKFSDAEHQAGIKDLEAAWEFLKSRGASAEKTVVVGASIGANLSLQFAGLHPDLSGVIALSAGNYRGLDSGKLVQKLSPSQKALFVASKQDERAGGDNAKQNQEYYKLAAAKNKHLIIFEGAGHGTDLFSFKAEYDLIGAIKKFLEHGSIN
jgi:pimeloyl-ACP methyl ester carboxylesterase